MRSPFLAAALAGVVFCFVQAAPPRKAPKSSIKAPVDIPMAGASGELLDLAAGRSRGIGSMLESRTDFQATSFPDGRVLITGGSLKGGTSEWFDPGTRRFSSGPAMVQTRQGHRALLLKSGSLLVLGGTENPSPAEFLEPGGMRFQPLSGEAKFGLSAEAVELEEGVLLLDGQEGKSWIWDGKCKVKATGTLNQPRILFRAQRLADGRALVTGGWPATPTQPERRGVRRPVPPKTVPVSLPAETFNPRKGRWSAWKAPLQPRARHQAALLKDGRVALFGGFGATAESTAEALEVLDPAKETVSLAGKLPPAENQAPGWMEATDGGFYLPERSMEPRRIQEPEALLQPAASNLRLANAYLAPSLVPLKGAQVLVLGSAIWGPALERWDPRTRQCQYLGTLRAGTESLALLDGQVIALGPVLDRVDPRSGSLTPLGRREEMVSALKKAKLYTGSLPASALPAPDGRPLKDALVVGLDGKKALVLGGFTEDAPQGTDRVWIWDLKKKSLVPSGPMKAKRVFASAPRSGEGALKLPDGSVLIWSAQ